ncbi:hypothetical protein WMY93_009077 [Mugilogobius chulae]|uniref:BEN domain-containing protein n=1 Tax=Mugilogobius chulae TaxID=88201 RepID=A0AAW0PL03_9GOBI
MNDQRPSIDDSNASPRIVRRFAVVEWKTGEDAGKFSEVKTDAIRSYDDSKFDDSGYPQSEYSAVVEWQKGKKNKHGWPAFTAFIRYVSNNRFYTSSKLREFINIDSIGKPLPKKRPSQPPPRYMDSDSETDLELEKVSSTFIRQAKMTTLETSAAKKIIEKYDKLTKPSQSHDRLLDLEEENARLRNENERLKTCWLEVSIVRIPQMIGELKSALTRGSSSSVSSDVEGGHSTPPVLSPCVPKTTSSADQAKPSTEKVEITPGSQVYVDKLAWAVAQNANSASCFIRTLLTAVFPMDVLLVSNLRGTSRDSSKPGRQALEKTKVDAIYRATLEKWPHIAPSQIGAVINSKLTEIRGKKKQKNLDNETLMLFDDDLD